MSIWIEEYFEMNNRQFEVTLEQSGHHGHLTIKMDEVTIEDSFGEQSWPKDHGLSGAAKNASHVKWAKNAAINAVYVSLECALEELAS